MKKINFEFSVYSVLALVAALASGCSSSLKQTNPRMGLLDQLSGMEPANRSTPLNARYTHESAERLAATRAPMGSQNIRGARTPATEAVPASAKNVSLRWPLKQVQITSQYGQRGREFHEGVDLRAKVGTPVYAAHSGQVLYAGDRIRGYGRMIVIKHTSGLATIYAHNSRLSVRKGQWVSQGTLIGYTGNTGHSHGPHLHFEVRSGVSTINPLSLLPRPKFSAHAESESSPGKFVAQD